MNINRVCYYSILLFKDLESLKNNKPSVDTEILPYYKNQSFEEIAENFNDTKTDLSINESCMIFIHVNLFDYKFKQIGSEKFFFNPEERFDYC